MASPLILVVVVFSTIAGIAGLVIYMLAPAREKFLSDDAPVNDSRISTQWAGADDTPSHHLHIVHHDGGHGGFGGG